MLDIPLTFFAGGASSSSTGLVGSGPITSESLSDPPKRSFQDAGSVRVTNISLNKWQ